jgi:hypothetical protein
MLSTGQCGDIIRDNSYMCEYQKMMRNKYGSFYRFDNLASLDVNYIEFKYPVFDLPIIKNLKNNQGYLIDNQAILGELKSKLVDAENSKD